MGAGAASLTLPCQESVVTEEGVLTCLFVCLFVCMFSVQQHKAAQVPCRGTGRAKLNYVKEYTVRGLHPALLARPS
jgi:hypothetical protein